MYSGDVLVCRHIFCDFGNTFTVADTDGEQPTSVMIAAVTKVQSGLSVSSSLLLLIIIVNS